MKLFKIIISIILTLSFFVLLFNLINLNMINNLYIIITIILLLIINGLLIRCIFKSNKKIINVIAYIIIFLLVIVNCIGNYYLIVTNNFIKKFDNEVIEYDYYYLLTLKDNNINNISDLENKIIGVTDNNKDKLDKYLDIKLDKRINNNITDLISDFYVKNLDCVLVNEIEKYVWEEYDEKLFNNIKVLKVFKEKQNNNKKLNKDVNLNINTEDPFIIYISGIDNNNHISSIGRSDVNIIMTVNPETKQILLTSIPRDYYVQLHGTTGVRDKLTHAGVYGIDMSLLTIEDLLGIDINYYAKVNFNTVTDLINLVGGIDVYSDINIRHCNVVPGNNHLNGKNALCFARERKSYAQGDRQRGVNQEIVIDALIKKISTSKDLLLKYNDVLNIVNNNLNTNIDSKFIKQMVGYQLDKMPTWEVKFLNLDGYGSNNITYSCGNMVLYVMEPDYNTVNNAKNAINDVLNDKKFSEMSVQFTR